MKYISQIRYEHIPYPTNIEDPNDVRMHEGTISSSGCGLCSLCMMVDQLTTKELKLRDCLQMALDSGANHYFGTDMKILGPVVAEKYNLNYKTTSDVNEMVKDLQNGACAIANVGGDREGHVGVFSHVGHFMTVISATDQELCILDPSLNRKGKIGPAIKAGLVRRDGNIVYCAYDVLDQDTANRTPRYYVFSRK